MEGNNDILIIDHGEYNIKVGLISDNKPTLMRSICGAKRNTVGRNMIIGFNPNNRVGNETSYYGEIALEKANVLRIEKSIINRTELRNNASGLFKKILDDNKLFDGMKYNVKVVYLTSSFADKILEDAIMIIFLKDIKVDEVYIVPQAVCAAYYMQVDGVLDIGESVSEFTIVDNNKIILKDRAFLGGSDLTNYLKDCFDDGEYLKSKSIEDIRKFKETNIKIALSENEKSQIQKVKLVVEDDSEHIFGKELYECSEIFFKPSMIKKEEISILELIKTNVEKEKIKTLCIIGGSANIPNLTTKIQSDLETLGIEVKKNENLNLNEINWLGAKKMINDGLLLTKENQLILNN